MSSHAEDDDVNRRDFLVIAGNTFAAVGAAATLWPFIDQMNPDASAQALASTEVDLASVAEGQAITVLWRGKPVFIRHRTPDEIARAQFQLDADGKPVVDDKKVPKPFDLAQLTDDKARNLALPEPTPADDANRIVKGHDKWLVLIGVCTHLGCIPKGQTTAEATMRGDYNGWFCPCHGSHYDTSGRIRKGPAPRNLDVPPYEFVSDTKIVIGALDKKPAAKPAKVKEGEAHG